MNEPIEAFVKDGILRFDGLVLEYFAPTSDGSNRYHVQHIAGIGLAKGLTGIKLKIRLASGFEQNIGFEPENQGAIEELVHAVWEAHG